MQLVARPRPRFAVLPTKSASLSRRGRSLHGTMVFLLFDQMHGEIVRFLQRKAGLSGPFIRITLGVIVLVTVLVLELGRRPDFFANSRSLARLSPSNWSLRVRGDFRQFSFGSHSPAVRRRKFYDSLVVSWGRRIGWLGHRD